MSNKLQAFFSLSSQRAMQKFEQKTNRFELLHFSNWCHPKKKWWFVKDSFQSSKSRIENCVSARRSFQGEVWDEEKSHIRIERGQTSPRHRSDLKRPEANKIQWKNNVRDAQDWNLSRLVKPLTYTVSALFLFSSNQCIFKLNTITGHHKIPSPEVFCSMTCQWWIWLREEELYFVCCK